MVHADCSDGTTICVRASRGTRDGWRWQGGYKPRLNGGARREIGPALLHWLGKFGDRLFPEEHARVEQLAKSEAMQTSAADTLPDTVVVAAMAETIPADGAEEIAAAAAQAPAAPAPAAGAHIAAPGGPANAPVVAEASAREDESHALGEDLAKATWQHQLDGIDAYVFDELLLQTVPTQRHIPKKFQGPFREVLAKLLAAIVAAANDGDTKRQERLEKLLLLLPRCVLRAPPPPGPHDQPSVAAHKREAYTMARFQSFLRGEWSMLLLPEVARPAKQPWEQEQEEDLTADRASRAIGALKSGNLTKAMTQLMSLGVAPATSDTARTVASMLCPRGDALPTAFEHLRRSSTTLPTTTTIRPTTSSTPTPIRDQTERRLTTRELTQHLRLAGRGKAKDVTGWAAEHLCVVLGHRDLANLLTEFFNLLLRGGLTEAMQHALAFQVVTPLNKGTKGKLRPLGCAATFRRAAYGALVRAESQTLAGIFGKSQYAVGRKAALESLARDVQAEMGARRHAAVAQFDCSSAFNYADRALILARIEELAPHLAPAFATILLHTTQNLVRQEDGSYARVPSNDGLTQGCPASPAAFSFLVMEVERFFWEELARRGGADAVTATSLLAYLDDLTLVTEAEYLEMTILSLEAALVRARLVVNQTKGTAWTVDGQRPTGQRAGAMWDNAADHEGFILAGCPGTFEELPALAPLPIPVGSEPYVARFLRARAEATKTLAQRIQAIPLHAPAGLPAVQAASCLLRECIPQRSVHLLRVLATDMTEEFTQAVDASTAEAGQRILDLSELQAWQREALFEPLDRGGWGLWSLHQRRHAARLGGMVAAAASPTELAHAATSDKSARDLDVELDRVKNRFGIDVTAVLRRSQPELVRGGIGGGQARVQNQVTKNTTEQFRDTLTPFVASWLDGASSKNGEGEETSPGASAWVAARPVGPTSTLHDTLFRIAVRLRFLVPLCGLGTSCSCAPTTTGAACGKPLDPQALHAMVCSRAQMSWRHDLVAETWAAVSCDAGLSAHLRQKAVEFPPGTGLRRESDVYCRGAGGDLPVHADVVVTSSAHCPGGRWEVTSDGIAVAREARRKQREWGEPSLSHAPARLVPLAFESQGKWCVQAVEELARLARFRSSQLSASPQDAAQAAAACQRRWRTWVSIALQRGNAAMVLAALGKPLPGPVDADLLQAAPDVHED